MSLGWRFFIGFFSFKVKCTYLTCTCNENGDNWWEGGGGVILNYVNASKISVLVKKEQKLGFNAFCILQKLNLSTWINLKSLSICFSIISSTQRNRDQHLITWCVNLQQHKRYPITFYFVNFKLIWFFFKSCFNAAKKT